MNIAELVARRSDLSTFVVHLTRDQPNGQTAKDALRSILSSRTIEARSIFGLAKAELERRGQSPTSQRCVCFTETPLEYLFLLCQEIEYRAYQLKPYGIAVTKKIARQMGVNPVWYLDITPGHNWLTEPANVLLRQALASSDFPEYDPMAQLAPFLEQMGTSRSADGSRAYRKEFWWEREWRHVGRFNLPRHVILLAPEGEHEDLSANANACGQSATLVDPGWGLEQIIARLAGFQKEEIEVL